MVGDPQQMEALLVIDQADIDFVLRGQEVEVKLDKLPHDTFVGTIDKISEEEMEYSPKRLSSKSGGDLSTQTDPESGVERPMSTSYQASVPLPDPDRPARHRPARQRQGPRPQPDARPTRLASGDHHVQLQAVAAGERSRPLPSGSRFE